MKNFILASILFSLFFVVSPLEAGANQKAPAETSVFKQRASQKSFFKKQKKDFISIFKKKQPKKRVKDNRIINGFAIASLVSGLVSGLSLLIALIIGGGGIAILWILGGVLAVIFGIVGLIQIRRYYDEFKGKELAIVGIIIGGAGAVIPFFISLILFILFF